MNDVAPTENPDSKTLFVKSALLATGWARNVCIRVDGAGRIAGIKTGQRGPEHGAQVIGGVLLPGIANCHSHAFQRAMVGLAEVRSPGRDDFWGWREAMYRFLAAIGPDELYPIARQLYVEMLRAGYTGVAEFHYLHHAPDGKPYDNPAQMSQCIIEAASDAGIHLTLLPVLYQYSDFGGVAAGVQQQRFLHSGEAYHKLLQQLAHSYPSSTGLQQGIALHSLRAVDETLLNEALTAVDGLHPGAPIHIHIAEQMREVEACMAHSGQRPVDWLLDHVEVDDRWCLVHATHLSARECRRLADSTAVAGLCPTTEANLGDGLFPAVDFLAMGGRFAVGSDSHVSVSPVEELRLLEYGQRLQRRERTLLADSARPSVASRLLTGSQLGGAQALGVPTGSISRGKSADFIAVDDTDPVLYGRSEDQLLDSWVFASQRPAVRQVMVAGQWRVLDGRHPKQDQIQQDFFLAIDRLLDRA